MHSQIHTYQNKTKQKLIENSRLVLKKVSRRRAKERYNKKKINDKRKIGIFVLQEDIRKIYKYKSLFSKQKTNVTKNKPQIALQHHESQKQHTILTRKEVEGINKACAFCFERAQKDGLPLKQVSSGDRNTGTIGYRLQK